MVYDWDETTGSWEYYTAIQTDKPYTDMIDLRADAFLDGLLLPANPTDPVEGTAVESVTWGRIKGLPEIKGSLQLHDVPVLQQPPFQSPP